MSLRCPARGVHGMDYQITAMNDDGRTTSQQLYIPTLLVVGGCDALVARCRRAAETSGLVIKSCLLHEAAITVPYRQPLATVVPNDVYDRAAVELEALVRDVRSVLLRVDSEVSVRELEAMIAGAIHGCLSQRERRGGAGRYSITEGVEDEAPFSSRSTAPPSSSAVRQSLPPSSSAVRQSLPPSSSAVRQSLPPSSGDVRQSVPSGVRQSLLPSLSDARQSLPPSSGDVRQSVPGAPRSSLAPGIASTRPPPAVSTATEPPPVSGAQPKATGPFAALRAVFSSR
jgi:hypothetical protein